MFFSISIAGVALASLSFVSAASIRQNPEVVTRDFVIVGGGSTGTYSAVRLRDLNHSVIVVEKKTVLGGNCETYIDPATKIPVDIGVVTFNNFTVVTDYFAKFNVDLVPLGASGQQTSVTSDLRTGASATGTAYTSTEIYNALGTYSYLLSQYPYLRNGFELPNPVPEDLLLSFGDFVEKFGLQAIVPTWYVYGQGLGNLLDHTTLSVFKRLSLGVLEGMTTGFLTAPKGCHELYDKAFESLRKDVLLNSVVKSTSRRYDKGTEGYVSVVVDTPTGEQTIHAKKIIFTAPHKLDNFIGFDLDEEEKAVFSKFNHTSYYTALVANTGFPDDLQVVNTAPETRYNLPILPAPYVFNPVSVSGLKDIFYGSPNDAVLSDKFVKDEITTAVQNFQKNNGYPTTTPEFVAFAAHTPFDMRPSVADIEAGFYSKLYALQGRNNMYYTGGAFHTYDSSALWQFTEALLPKFTEHL